MPEAMEFEQRQVERFHEFFVIGAVCSGFCRFGIVRQHKELAVDDTFDWFQHFLQIAVHGHFPDGVFGFRTIENEFCFSDAIFDHIDALNGSADADDTVVGIYVVPRESADFADSHTDAEAYIDAEVPEREMFLDVSHDLFLVCAAKHFDC